MLDCTLPGTTDFDEVFRVCLLLNYFLKSLVWWIHSLNTIEGEWGHKPPFIMNAGQVSLGSSRPGTAWPGPKQL